jgi:hypothetical protein
MPLGQHALDCWRWWKLLKPIAVACSWSLRRRRTVWSHSLLQRALRLRRTAPVASLSTNLESASTHLTDTSLTHHTRAGRGNGFTANPFPPSRLRLQLRNHPPRLKGTAKHRCTQYSPPVSQERMASCLCYEFGKLATVLPLFVSAAHSEARRPVTNRTSLPSYMFPGEYPKGNYPKVAARLFGPKGNPSHLHALQNSKCYRTRQASKQAPQRDHRRSYYLPPSL